LSPKLATVAIHRGRTLTFSRFRVRVVAGPDVGAEQSADTTELSIGSAEECSLRLTDRSVSRHHCAIGAGSGGYALRDLASRNGTWVGACRIETVYLEPGATFSVGESQLVFEILNEQEEIPLASTTRFGRLLGTSPAMRHLFALAERVAPSESTVLLEAETGTGKGLLAEAIHQASARAKGPFVVVDCSSIAPTLIESELFGHEKGAFTGAHSARAGSFEAARGGTLFLDEIGELPLDMQPKLLRALEERVIRRVGSTQEVKLDLRLVAATNRDLRREVNAGRFRADLYYRLHIVKLTLPPLRERSEDIPDLVAHFWAQIAGEGAGPPASDMVLHFAQQPWPGNVRELRAAVERAVLLGPLAAPPPAAPKSSTSEALDKFQPSKERVIAAWEREYLQALMTEFAGNVSRAARFADMDRGHLRVLLKKYGLQDSR
jgi:two-component system response regulator GlrR